jgi:hypothetical protein
LHAIIGKQIHIMQQLSLPTAGSSNGMIPTRTTSDNGRERKGRLSDAEDTPATAAVAAATTTPTAPTPLANSHGLPAGIAPYFVVNMMLPAYAPANPVWGATVEVSATCPSCCNPSV